MNERNGLAARAAHFLHAHFLWLLLGSYVLAALWPAAGLTIRHISFGEIHLFGRLNATLPVVMLACLLLNAGLGVQTSQLKALARGPLALAAGLAANLLIPITFIFAVTRVMGFWHNPDEVQNILVGLALVASMPIAGSSTAWAQNAEGNMALSLGLVLGSTLLSPVTTPLALHAVGLLATGGYARTLHHLAAGGTGAFLAVSVIAPVVLGMAARKVVGGERVAAVKPLLKLINCAVLLILNYSNASVSLPQAVAHPDADFLAAILVITLGMCALAFGAGAVIARLLRCGGDQRASLMFGLGMNNNGTGLVLASLALADHPRVMLPLIFYTLVQHLVAGAVDFLFSRPTDALARADGVPDVRQAGTRPAHA